MVGSCIANERWRKLVDFILDVTSGAIRVGQPHISPALFVPNIDCRNEK